jgi:UDP-glucose 4-epimerase
MHPQPKKKEVIFLTGATGYIGGVFLEAAVRSRYPATFLCLARNPPKKSFGSAKSSNPTSVEWLKGDLTRSGPWRHRLPECTTIIHLATLPLPDCETNPELGVKVILTGLKNLMEGASRMGKKETRFIMASTGEVYGIPKKMPITERAKPRPLSVYGFLKACADEFLLAGVTDFKPCILRFFNVYGKSSSVIPQRTVLTLFAEKILGGAPIILHGPPTNSRDFIHVSDVANSLLLALGHSEAEGIFNIGSGRETRLLEAATKLARIAGKNLKIDHQPNAGRFRRSVADIGRARQILGFRPKVSLDPGLREVLDEVRFSRHA